MSLQHTSHINLAESSCAHEHVADQYHQFLSEGQPHEHCLQIIHLHEPIKVLPAPTAFYQHLFNLCQLCFEHTMTTSDSSLHQLQKCCWTPMIDLCDALHTQEALYT